jgi:ribonucleoside-diphosphate reductase beta chain
MSIFDKRVAFKPFEYPEMMDFVDAVNSSYWVHRKWNYHSDIQDFNVRLTDVEKNAIKNTLLAISQIEISVKTFWGKLYDHFPKPEFAAVGFTMAESEVRHERSYSHLLEVLHLNHDFDLLLQNPVIQGRIDYLSKYLRNSGSDNKQVYTLTLALFSLFIENVSLFSQFAIIKAFNKKKNLLKDVENVVQATQKEEQLHGLLGAHILNLIKKEFPEWFDEDFYKKIERACRKAYDAELNIIKWIFEQGELDFIPISLLDEFIKNRFNESLEMIGANRIFDVNQEVLEDIKWFDEGIKLQTSIDFFNKKSNNYSKNMVSVTSKDLFD